MPSIGMPQLGLPVRNNLTNDNPPPPSVMTETGLDSTQSLTRQAAEDQDAAMQAMIQASQPQPQQPAPSMMAMLMSTTWFWVVFALAVGGFVYWKYFYKGSTPSRRKRTKKRHFEP